MKGREKGDLRMNRLAIISGFLGAVKNRYMVYKDDRPLGEKMQIASGIEGIDGLELCYPADFDDPAELKVMLEKYNFGVSAVNFRSRRTGKWWRGSFTSESSNERQEVVDDLKRAMDFAAELGCNRITTCPLNDGSDYLFETDYVKVYDYAAETFSAACAHNRDVRICIEYKESDPRARCVFGSAGETASFCQLIGTDNLGATLDIGHAIYAGERPAQSAALLARANRLFYVHLNDNDGRWDWDMLPGAYHLWEFVEMFYYLRNLGYRDDWYAFDVFSKEIDTMDTFNAVVVLTRKLEALTDRIDRKEMQALLKERNPSKTIPYLYSLL
ncbi:MAG: TIM barrel protein [Proteobacteria bacterium]|nr:TIM barrel protein [Pseudomonadota bacterium]